MVPIQNIVYLFWDNIGKRSAHFHVILIVTFPYCKIDY